MRGSTVSVNWSGLGVPTPKDWIALYAVGAPHTNRSGDYYYTNATASGAMSYMIPANVPVESYEFRLFASDTYRLLATTVPFAVSACTTATISESPSPVLAGANVTGTWSNICIPTSTDWFGIYAPGAQDTSFLAWTYTTGIASASKQLRVPYNLAGTYELRLFATDAQPYARLATSATFTVSGCSTATVSRSPSTVPAGGSITASWSGLCVPTTSDWIALAQVGAPNNQYVASQFTNTTATSGGMTFAIPSNVQPGTYELRFFPNWSFGGYFRLATSNTLTVTTASTSTTTTTHP
jgi:hypothetical protein